MPSSAVSACGRPTPDRRGAYFQYTRKRGQLALVETTERSFWTLLSRRAPPRDRATPYRRPCPHLQRIMNESCYPLDPSEPMLPDPEGLLCQVDATRVLPALPEHHLQLQELNSCDAPSNIQGLTQLAEHDPGIAATLVRSANASTRNTLPVDNLRRAVQVLGAQGVSEALLAVDMATTRLHDIASVWHHSVQVAQLARELAERNGLPPEQAYLLGLLHDLSLVILPRQLPQIFLQLLQHCPLRRLTLHQTCLRLFGCTPLDVTARMLERWNFPGTLWRPLQTLGKPWSQQSLLQDRLALVLHQAHELCLRHTEHSLPWDSFPELDQDQLRHAARIFRFIPEFDAAVLVACG